MIVDRVLLSVCAALAVAAGVLGGMVSGWLLLAGMVLLVVWAIRNFSSFGSGTEGFWGGGGEGGGDGGGGGGGGGLGGAFDGGSAGGFLGGGDGGGGGHGGGGH